MLNLFPLIVLNLKYFKLVEHIQYIRDESEGIFWLLYNINTNFILLLPYY